MKHNYTKPLLILEPVMLTQTAARDCNTSAVDPNRFTLGDPGACAYDPGNGTTIFIAGSTCMLDGESMGYGCYNNPGEGNYIFRS
jgi:hypothetical protein